MKTHRIQFAVLVWVLVGTAVAFAQEKKKASPPVEFPKLAHFGPLWQRSIFTTKDLPAPEEPGGPNFVDNLSLSGIYEIDGGVVAVLVDRTTSQVMEARIGSENEVGVKIRQVTPGATIDKTRIQLQKGDKTGWVTFADTPAPQPAETVQRAVVPAQGGRVPGGTRPGAAAPIMPQRRSPGQPVQRAPGTASPNPILPPPPTASTRAVRPGDVPLPPP